MEQNNIGTHAVHIQQDAVQLWTVEDGTITVTPVVNEGFQTICSVTRLANDCG